MFDAEREAALRQRALLRLTGSADPASPLASSVAALGMLYELSSSAETAATALGLLHEMQVYQVEVELQGEELRHSRIEIEARLHRYVQLHDLAPFAYFTIGADTAICEANLAGARLLGADRGVLVGCRLDTFLAPDGASALRAMLGETLAGAAERTLAMANPADGAARTLHVSAVPDALAGRFLVAMIEVAAAGRATS